MSAGNPTAPEKPSKPYPDFPLFPHATRRWAKKIRGRMHYFGPWGDPDGALAKYLAEKDDLHAGRTPPAESEEVTVMYLCNMYLTHKKAMLDAGELSPRTWKNYKEAKDLLVSQFGKGRLVEDLRTDDFAALKNWMTRRWGPVRVRDFIQRVRSVFKFGYDSGVLPAPMRFGPGFDRPAKKTIRLARARKGPRMFEAAELRLVLAALAGEQVTTGRTDERTGKPVAVNLNPNPTLRAMVLLGVNCGFGNADCGTLPRSALDLAGGWVNYHRPKTGITRRCPLWPETVEALREALAARPGPKAEEDEDLVFLTVRGGSWHKATDDNPVSKETRKLLDALGIEENKNFYALRHCFETIGGEAKDQVAVDHIMGHAKDDMASTYRERVGDERLRAVADHVRGWLFADRKAESKAG